MNYLILQNNDNIKHLSSAIEKRGHTWEHLKPQHLALYVSESVNGFDRLYNADPALAEPKRIKAKDYGCVISRIGSGVAYGSNILRHLTENLKIYCPQTPDGIMTARDKIKTAQVLSSNGIKVPLTIMANNTAHIDFFIEKVGGYPAIAKTLTGSNGVGVIKLESQAQTKSTLQIFDKMEVDILIQKFVESNATDYRAIVVNNLVVSSMQRKGKDGEFRSNVSIGGRGLKVEMSQEDQALCVKAAKAVGLSFAGVDLIKDKDGTSFIVEVNGNPGQKIIDITGYNHFIDLVDFCEPRGKFGQEVTKQDFSPSSIVAQHQAYYPLMGSTNDVKWNTIF